MPADDLTIPPGSKSLLVQSHLVGAVTLRKRICSPGVCDEFCVDEFRAHEFRIEE